MENNKELDKVLEKIHKLQALQQSAYKVGSIEEAANAAEKIQRLLLKYNLDLAALEDKNPYDEVSKYSVDGIEAFDFNKRESLWIPQLANAIADFFFCRVLMTQTGGGGLILTFYGKKPNIVTTLNATTNLVSAIRFFAKKSWAELKHISSEKKGSYFRSYFQGAVTGLIYKLREIKAEQEKQDGENASVEIEGTTLPMVILNQVAKKEKALVNKYFEENVEYKTKTHKSRGVSLGTMEGFKKGKTLSPQDSLT